MWNRIKKWWNSWQEETNKQREAECHTYKFTAYLTDGDIIEITEKFRTWWGDEWSGIDSHKTQAERRVHRLGTNGFWQGNTYYPSSNIKYIVLQEVNEQSNN